MPYHTRLHMDGIYHTLLSGLSDTQWTVREDAAIALGLVLDKIG